MSRIGLKPVNLPAGVEVKVDDNNLVTVKGPKGELQEQISSLITVEQKDGVLTVSRDGDEKEKREQHGLARALINNMVVGVSEGYQKKLEIIGVGYKAEKKGKNLVLSLGFSHPVELQDPEGIETECPSATEILVKGINKTQVGNYAADIRALRKPEPYKGKGIRYEGEYVRRKEGKAGVATASV
ncbi:MAG: 50S ribosomal protein L6 [Firmicutes bacterium]|nr:50S ribosomal protein L6 [Bacillota bacterium]MDO4860375.1 50S ribosomal protein L6 [Bacillota bacterium]